MDNFILFAATRFGTAPADARVLTGALLWIMQLNAADDFGPVHTLDPEVHRLIERAPSALSSTRRDGHRLLTLVGRGRVCGTQAALLRLFAQHGFSLARAGRFTQALLHWLGAEVGHPQVERMAAQVPVLQLLRQPSLDSRPEVRIERRSALPALQIGA